MSANYTLPVCVLSRQSLVRNCAKAIWYFSFWYCTYVLMRSSLKRRGLGNHVMRMLHFTVITPLLSDGILSVIQTSWSIDQELNLGPAHCHKNHRNKLNSHSHIQCLIFCLWSISNGKYNLNDKKSKSILFLIIILLIIIILFNTFTYLF